MNEYIFYTAEGYTMAPNENVNVENCQLLGTAMGNDEYEAKSNLLNDNPWIIEAGFSPSEIWNRQLAK